MGLKKATVVLGADIKQFTSKMKKASRSFKRMGQSMKRLGSTMSMSLTLPLVAFAAASVKAFDDQAKAEAKLLTALNGNEAAFKSLKEQAQELQKVTLFGDEQTIAAQSMLATMGLEEEAIKRLTPLIQDMATAKGMDLVAAADLVAKSVGSSTNALSRYGIQIEGAVGSSDRLDSAVEALSGQFKGQSEAAAEAGAGGLTQLKNSFGDLMETIGEALMPVLTRLMDKIQVGVEALQRLSTEQLKSKIKWFALAAAIGPVLIILGSITKAVGVLIPAFGRLTAVMAANPYLVLGAAVGLLILKMTVFSRKTKQTAIDLSNLEKPASDAAKRLLEINNELDRAGKSRFDLLKTEAIEQQARILEEINGLTFLAKDRIIELNKEYNKWGDTLNRVKQAEKDFNKSLEDVTPEIKEQEEAVLGVSVAMYQLEIQLAALREEHSKLGNDIIEQTTSLQAWGERWKTLAISIGESFSQGFVNVFDTMTDAEGKILSFGEKFKNFAGDFLKQIAKMIVQAAVFAAIMTAISGGAAAGGASFGQLFESTLTGVAIPGKASGGPVAGNTPYIVGEVGPELFVPNSSGTIIPNHQLGGSQTIIPDVRITGSDLLLVFNKTQKEEGGVNA